MKIAIIGSRNYIYPHLVRWYVEEIANKWSNVTIVSGGARGPDTIAEITAERLGLKTLIFYANWKKYGRSAGFKRNRDIIEACDAVIAFWDRVSKGTQHSIKIAVKLNKPRLIEDGKECISDIGWVEVTRQSVKENLDSLMDLHD